MKVSFSNFFQFLYILGYFWATSGILVAQQPDLTGQEDHTLILAQVTPDRTVNTQVNNNGNVSEITGGETRGDNLFHSFQDFSVPTNNEAFFNNADDIANIFSRVTGGNISNIDGVIRANGSASLFLINPAGIIFGENASLNIGGSFYGSSASSILFEDGEFSAVDLDTPPILTINAPIGLSFRNEPGDIASTQSTLRLNNGQNLVLLGGNLDFQGGTLRIFGGNVRLGGLSEAGVIDIDRDGSLDFPEAITRGNVSLSNSARILVAGDGGGSIEINAKNLSLTSGTFVAVGIVGDSGFPDAQAGDIVVDLTKDLTIDNSNITNSNTGTGNAGNVIVDARNVTFNNGGSVFNFNSSIGNIGDIIITATEDITFDGFAGSNVSGISTNFSNEEATGSIGEINLTARNLSLTNGANIASRAGNDDSGDINLNIADTIAVDGLVIEPQIISQSSINSQAFGNGNSGDININTQNLSLSSRGNVSTFNIGQGNAGNIDVNVDSLSITEGGDINASISGVGNGGNIIINADDTISVDGIYVDGRNPEFNSNSAIFARVSETGIGNAGNIEINAATLSINNDAFISADVLGEANGGEITISTSDSVELLNGGFISASVFEGAEGNGGNLNIETTSLSLDDNSYISANVQGGGNGGEITISATDSIELSNISFIQADVPGITGDGGNLDLETTRLTLNSGSQISATTFSNGNAGNVNIRADESISLSGTGELGRSGILATALEGNGEGGNLNLTSDKLSISDGAIISTGNFSSLGEEVSGIAPGTGEPGNILITANSLNLSNEGRIEAVTQAETGEGANIDLQITEGIFLSGSSFISAQALNTANGGNINIDSDFIIAFPNGNNDIIASAARGNGGNIEINAESLLGIQQRPLGSITNDINASSEFSLDGTVTVKTPDLNPVESATELPTNIVVPEQTTAQACQANREVAAQNGLTIGGKGGIPPAPELPLDSLNIAINSEIDSITAIPKPIETSSGKIQPARGVEVNKNGVILTAYRTNSLGERISESNINCGV